MDLTPKQQTSEAIRQATTILITTGERPTIDQVSAVISLAMVLRKLDKKVTAIISDQLPANLDFLSLESLDKNLSGSRDFILKVATTKTQVESLKYTQDDGKLNIHITPARGGFAPSDVTFDYGAYRYDVAITLGVASKNRLDRLFEQNPQLFAELPILNIDFHRSNELYGAVNLIDPQAASLCEMLVALSESLQTGMIDETIATAMLTGIIASTDRFTAVHTTPKALTVAAQMMAAGAKQQTVVKALYKDRGGRPERRETSSPAPKASTSTPRIQPNTSAIARAIEAAKAEAANRPEITQTDQNPTDSVEVVYAELEPETAINNPELYSPMQLNHETTQIVAGDVIITSAPEIETQA